VRSYMGGEGVVGPWDIQNREVLRIRDII